LGLGGKENLMAMAKITTDLSDKELLFGYKEIILYFEKVIKKSSNGFNARNQKFNSFLKEHDITIEYKTTDELKNETNNTEAFFLFTFSYQKSKQLSILPSLLNHLRNSFAHGLVSKKKIKKTVYLCFKDYNTSINCTMRGQIPNKSFVPFIAALKQAKK